MPSSLPSYYGRRSRGGGARHHRRQSGKGIFTILGVLAPLIVRSIRHIAPIAMRAIARGAAQAGRHAHRLKPVVKAVTKATKASGRRAQQLKSMRRRTKMMRRMAEEMHSNFAPDSGGDVRSPPVPLPPTRAAPEPTTRRRRMTINDVARQHRLQSPQQAHLQLASRVRSIRAEIRRRAEEEARQRARRLRKARKEEEKEEKRKKKRA